MNQDDTDRILQILNELEEIPSDTESIVSDNTHSDDHELMAFDRENETVHINSGNLDLYQLIDISDLPVEYEDGFIDNVPDLHSPTRSIEYNTHEVQDSNNHAVETVENSNRLNEEIILARIHKECIKWYNEYSHIDKNNFFGQSVGPNESAREHLVDPFNAFLLIFPENS